MTGFITCNFNCICTKSDCYYNHYLKTLEERRFASKVYRKIPNVKEAVNEDNTYCRKRNCLYGQLCDRSCCGYRHYLNHSTRLIFIANLDKARSTPSYFTKITNSSSKVSELKKNSMSIDAKIMKLTDILSSII